MARKPPERIKPKAAADICGVSTKTLLRLARQGKIPGAAPLDGDRLWTFDERALRGWLRHREGECQATAVAISNGAAKSGGGASRYKGETSVEAYERALAWKPGSG